MRCNIFGVKFTLTDNLDPQFRHTVYNILFINVCWNYYLTPLCLTYHIY